MKHILVTGGARGIGKAVVEELAGNGFEVTATYHDSKTPAEEIIAKYPNIKYEAVDLENRADMDALIEKLAKGKPIDVLINNAGVYAGKAFEKMSDAELYEQIDLNFTAPARIIHGLLPALKKSASPLIINISSQAVNEKIAGEAMYASVKTAVSTLSYILRAELNPKGIRVVTVEPFAVNTYGLPEPSKMILPEELARTIRYAIELPDHLQLDTLGISHVGQPRPDYPN